MRLRLTATLLAFATTIAFAMDAQQNDPPQKVKSMQEIIDDAPATDWRTLDPANTLYMQLATGRVVIELAPDFAPEHVANIRTLAKEGYWNDLAIIRSQDNYVVQWGDPNSDDAAKKKPLGTAKPKLPVEFERNA